MSKFDDTLQFISGIQAAATPDEVCQQLLNFSSQYGLDNLIAGTMPNPEDTTTDQQDDHAFLKGWPEGWLGRYMEKNYVFVDPIISRIKADMSPFEWDQAPVSPDVSDVAHTLFGEAREFGLGAGFAVPLITLEGRIASVSLGGSRVELPPRAKGMLSLISTYAMGRAIQLRTNRTAIVRQGLTARELECLKLAAVGKTEWEISVILKISEHTSAKHLNNARAKLGAVNRIQAVVNAIRFGILDINAC